MQSSLSLLLHFPKLLFARLSAHLLLSACMLLLLLLPPPLPLSDTPTEQSHFSSPSFHLCCFHILSVSSFRSTHLPLPTFARLHTNKLQTLPTTHFAHESSMNINFSCSFCRPPFSSPFSLLPIPFLQQHQPRPISSRRFTLAL
ncbi:hypothetical protein HDK77DRAFT_185837 [Phyllosticta capitalensis]